MNIATINETPMRAAGTHRRYSQQIRVRTTTFALRATFLNCDLALFNCHQFYALTLAIKLLKLCLQELESEIHLVAAFCIDLTSESRTLGFSTEVSITSWSSRLCIKIVPNEGGPPQFDPAFVFVENHI
jgi:hypothetical protein